MLLYKAGQTWGSLGDLDLKGKIIISDVTRLVHVDVDIETGVGFFAQRNDHPPGEVAVLTYLRINQRVKQGKRVKRILESVYCSSICFFLMTQNCRNPSHSKQVHY